MASTHIRTTREQFLSRIRTAVARLPAIDAPSLEALSVARRVPPQVPPAALVPMFCDAVVRVGMFTHRTSRANLGRTLCAVADTVGVSAMHLTSQLPLLDVSIDEAAANCRCKVHRWNAADPALFDVELGVSVAAAGVAETGSLLVHPDVYTARLASLLPPFAVVCVQAQTIVTDLLDLMSRVPDMFASHMPANLTFITGPSKTSDIEKTLVTGVHGPGRLDVVVIED